MNLNFGNKLGRFMLENDCNTFSLVTKIYTIFVNKYINYLMHFLALHNINVFFQRYIESYTLKKVN